MLDQLTDLAVKWIGSTLSLIVHTILFIAIFGLRAVGLSVDSILLILTTLVSLEAIYLAIFIQRSVNQSNAALAEVTEDIEEVTEDIDEIQEDIDEIQEDIDDIQEDECDDNTKPSKEPIVKQLDRMRKALREQEKLLIGIEKQLIEKSKKTFK